MCAFIRDYFSKMEETFVSSYNDMYKLLESSEATGEDFLKCIAIASDTCDVIKDLLGSGNSSRSEKFSLETSLAHFVGIICQLNNRVKQGGEIVQPSTSKVLSNEFASVTWMEVESSFKRRIRKGVVINLTHLDFDSFINEVKNIFETEIKKSLKEFNSIKVNTALSAKYTRMKNDIEEKDIFQFNGKNESVFQTTNLMKLFEDIQQTLEKKMSEFELQGSGWTLKSILHLAVNINKLNSMRAGKFIPLPKDIADKKACTNVKNTDDKCFIWSILAGLNNFNNPNNVSHYEPIENTLNIKGINLPIKPHDISKFERQNNISVNVYILNKHGNKHIVSPLHITSFKEEQHVNLLLIQNEYIDECDKKAEDNDDDTNLSDLLEYHYVTINSLSRLVASQLSKHSHKCFICDRCLHYFGKQEKLDAHEIDCAQLNKCKIVLPLKKDRILQFTNYNRTERVPVIVYADCESLLKPMEDGQPNFVVNNHKLLSIGYYVKYSDNINHDAAQSGYEFYRQLSEDEQSPAEWFVGKLKAIVENVENIYQNVQPMQLSKEEIRDFLKATKCHICNHGFSKKNVKVRDHCHLSGRFRGPAHQGKHFLEIFIYFFI